MKSKLFFIGLLTALACLSGCVKEVVKSDQPMTSEALSGRLNQNPRTFILVDVRTPEEYAAGHIPGAINIPVDKIAENPPTTDQKSEIVVYCRTGNRSNQAKIALEGKGYSNVINFGAVGNWKGNLVKGDKPE